MLTRAAVRHDDPLQSVAVHIDAAREQLERASEVVAHARQRVLVPGQCQIIMLSCRVQANMTDLVAMEPATIQRVEFHVTPWCLQPMEPRWKELLRTAHGKLGRQPPGSRTKQGLQALQLAARACLRSCAFKRTGPGPGCERPRWCFLTERASYHLTDATELADRIGQSLHQLLQRARAFCKI